jgi:hypothetical protein
MNFQDFDLLGRYYLIMSRKKQKIYDCKTVRKFKRGVNE